MIRLFDWLSQESLDLHSSLEAAGIGGCTVLINDDGCLPEGITSPYSFFCEMEMEKGSPLYFNQLEVPEFWQITGTNTKAEVWDYGTKKADIYYHEPKHLRLIKCVDWLGEDGQVIFTDHYNQHGRLFAKTYFDESQQAVMKSYRNRANQEILTEHLMTGESLLAWQGKTYHFKRKVDFFHFYFKVAKLDISRIWYNSLGLPFLISYYLQEEGEDILFWQERPRKEIPGNMRVILENKTHRTGRIIVQNQEAYAALAEQATDANMGRFSYLGYIYPSVRENQGRQSILILTNSDSLEGLETLVVALPDYTFHIGALTEMSQRLLQFEKYNHVVLYPNSTSETIERLFEECDIYLDINHGSEIVSSIRRAFENNLLIAGFHNTVHHADMVLNEAIFLPEESEKLVMYLRTVSLKEAAYRQRIMSGQETIAAYRTMLLSEELERKEAENA